MAWTAPATVVATQVFTATAFNTNIRDNLLETMPGLATTAASYFTTNSTSSIGEKLPDMARVITGSDETTTSTSFTDLATAGPAVTVNTGTSAMVFFSSRMHSSVVNEYSIVGVDISGATTVPVANDNTCLAWRQSSTTTGQAAQRGYGMLVTGLTEGNNTFTLKYRRTAASGTASFNNRTIIVLPL